MEANPRHKLENPNSFAVLYLAMYQVTKAKTVLTELRLIFELFFDVV